MSFSRWKFLAGVLSVSLGGLAAVSGQGPKQDCNKGSKNTTEVQLPDLTSTPAPQPVSPMPKMPPSAQAPLAPAQVLPTPDVIPPTPLAPSTPAGGLPGTPPPQSTLLRPPQAPTVTPLVPLEPVSPLPMTQVVPVGGTTGQQNPVPSGNVPIPPPYGYVQAPASVPASPYSQEKPSTASGPGSPLYPPLNDAGTDALVGGAVGAGAGAALGAVSHAPTTGTTTATKFRILLRVGEGEPTFEVRCGDDLMLKVRCDKVDVKSPEKVTGLSSVKASGKVHFVGFGAEGTCEELAFLAGAGEVSMTGNVKINVKDKLGRVESELTTESVKYKIDSSAVSGSLKP